MFVVTGSNALPSPTQPPSSPAHWTEPPPGPTGLSPLASPGNYCFSII